MARPTFERHPKTVLARARLGVSRALFRGIMEILWDAANESGQPKFSCPEAVEAVAEWTGEPGKLVAVLTQHGSNFLDKNDDGSVSIHDFWEHCPAYVRKRFQREQQRAGRGSKSVNNDAHLEDTDELSGDIVQSVTSQCPQNGTTPTPTPTLINTPSSVHTDGRGKLDAVKAEIQTAWNAMADLHDLPQIASWGAKRTKALRQRWAEPFWRDYWREAIDRVPENPWNLGQGVTSSGWKADIDWFLQDGKVTKLIESRPRNGNGHAEVDPELLASIRGGK